MSTAATSAVPPAIATWIAARTDPGQAHRLRDSFAPDVEFSFAGRHRSGVDAVVAYLEEGPSGPLATAERRVIDAGDGHYVVRFTGPDGAPMPGRGGLISAMDFEMTLNGDGLIAAISPNPRHTEPRDLAPALSPGDRMPAFALPDTHGERVEWLDDAAAAHVIIYTSNHCPWALGWHDRIQQVVRDYAPRGVRVIQVNANDPAVSESDSPERSRARVDAGEFAGPYLRDEGQVIARRIGARHTPDVFLVGPDGVVAYHGAPDADSEEPARNAEWLRAALDDVLAGRPVALPETEPIGCTIKWTL